MPKTRSETMSPEAVTTIDLRPPDSIVRAVEAFMREKPDGVPAPVVVNGQPLVPITTPDQRAALVARHAGASAIIKSIEAAFDPTAKLIRASLAKITETKASFLTGPIAVKDICSRSVTAYDAAQERERQKALEEARRKADDEARIKRQRELDALAAAAKSTKDAGVKQALKEQIAAVKEAPVIAAPVVLPETTERAKGEYTRVTWSAQVQDPVALLITVAAAEMIARLERGRRWNKEEIIAYLRSFVPDGCPVRPSLVQPSQTDLNALAEQYQQDLCVPGVAPVKKETLVTKTGRV